MQNKIISVRRVGFVQNMPDETRSPESFALPACMTSLLEALGEDVRWETIQAHGRAWTQRFVYKELLAASGMAFGLLWFDGGCPSCMDLTQVQAHDDTIRHAFEYAGYAHDIIERNDANEAELRARIVASLDAGRPVLAFGIVGPPECSIICGYEAGGEALLGWSHFQEGEETAENGMFRKRDWHKELWKIVLCGEKTERATALAPLLRRGIAIMEQTEADGYRAGFAAYDAWGAYLADAAYETMDEQTLRDRHALHHMLVGNHAEARMYLSNFLQDRAKGDADLLEAARCFEEIHAACWQTWALLGGISAQDGYLGLREESKRAELVAAIGTMKAWDEKGLEALRRYVRESE